MLTRNILPISNQIKTKNKSLTTTSAYIKESKSETNNEEEKYEEPNEKFKNLF